MRVAFVISAQHLIAAGGIGQFARSFCQQVANPKGWVVDFILDKEPSNDFYDDCDISGRVIYPNSPTSYSGHSKTHAFKDSINHEKSINFRDSFMLASRSAAYDLVVVNSVEAFAAIYGLSLQGLVPVVFYSHSEYLAGFEDYHGDTFSKEFVSYHKAVFGLPGVIRGTQTQKNVQRIKKTLGLDAVALPMPIPEPDLLKKQDVKKSGVLFMGRWEDRKNPKLFVEVVVKGKFFAKIMTNHNGAKKFEAAFKAANYTNYEIKAGIIGEAKVNFISSAQVYFNPSKLESFGFTMLEGLTQCHTVVCRHDWIGNFRGYDMNVIETKADDAVDLIAALLTKPVDTSKNLVLANEYNQEAIESWEKIVGRIPKPSSSKCQFVEHDDFYLEDYLTSLGRGVSIEDVQTVTRNKHLYTIVDTFDKQWYSKTGKEPEAKQTLESFF
jgi:glycosyltransferase involved in cell wall biosynthesis